MRGRRLDCGSRRSCGCGSNRCRRGIGAKRPLRKLGPKLGILGRLQLSLQLLLLLLLQQLLCSRRRLRLLLLL